MTISETAALLQAQDQILLLTHTRPDGDTLCSAAALAMGLRALGKEVYLLPALEATDKYVDFVAPLYASADFTPAFVVSVDLADEGLFPENAHAWLGRVDLSIDHHGSNTGYAAQTCVYPESAACGEVIYQLLCAMGAEITPAIASALYVAITTDTGCFAYANVTADTLRIASLLVAAGAEHARLNKIFFRTKTRSRIQMEGLILSGMEFHREDTLAIAAITQAMLAQTGATEGDLDDVAAIPTSIEGVQIGITVKERPDGTCKISVRTTPAYSANAICARFGGGGHTMAAGCTIAADVETAKRLLLAAVKEVCT